MHAYIKMLNKIYYDNNSMVININFITGTEQIKFATSV